MLLFLQSMWHGKYRIMLLDDDCVAERIGEAHPAITADSIYELRELIRIDAVAWNREKYGSKQ
jgi:hypothetical protein